MTYDHKKIELRWQKYWEQEKIFRASEKSPRGGASSGAEPKNPKFYILDMFAYPSGEGLHVGHPRGYTASDILAKYYKIKGKNVLHPFGWDAFGLPAENYAIKVGAHPRKVIDKNIEKFKRQLMSFGFGYDWEREIDTSKPDYYKWTQWVFKVLYDNGWAYQKEAYVNWCPSCQTVLANEQVINDKCERCKTKIEQKRKKQWFFKITDFAEDLINGLEKLDWPDSTKEMQKNWIGRSEGAEIEFRIKNEELRIKVFTTRPDTLLGATYIVLAPEHKLIQHLASGIQNLGEVETYIEQTKRKDTLTRQTQKDKSGVCLKGVMAINPATKEEIQIWVADYVLADYGFGAVMAVPAHDERDFEFATKYKLPIVRVIESREDLPYTGHGKLMNSAKFDGQNSKEAGAKIIKEVGGRVAVQYKLHDWLVSRQRYWGAPIPIIYKNDKPVSVDEKDLPVLLPEDVDFKPTGQSPLADSKEFQKGVEKKYGKGARRELDTLDTFVCSSWYFLRYCDPHNKKEFASSASLKQWMPVDLYIGGAEHTNGHLLYARFIVKALHKLGYLDFDEPFLKLRHQGLILGPDGDKMSKSKGNVINPDDVVEQYGADTMRMYEMFIGPFALSMPWSTRGIVGVRRFLNKVYEVIVKNKNKPFERWHEKRLHRLIYKITGDLENEKFNTAISAMMEFINEVAKKNSAGWETDFVRLLAPFAPHLAEEIWQSVLGNEKSVFDAKWPEFDSSKASGDTDTVTIIISENGKKRGVLELPAGANEKAVLEAIERDKRLSQIAKKSKKHIFIQDRIINFV